MLWRPDAGLCTRHLKVTNQAGRSAHGKLLLHFICGKKRAPRVSACDSDGICASRAYRSYVEAEAKRAESSGPARAYGSQTHLREKERRVRPTPGRKTDEWHSRVTFPLGRVEHVTRLKHSQDTRSLGLVLLREQTLGCPHLHHQRFTAVVVWCIGV